MAEQNKSDIELFKSGNPICYEVSYLGNGPDDNIIPDHIINRKVSIPGKLYFSLKGVKFKANNMEMLSASYFRFSMDELEGEKACHKNKILFITLLPRDANSEERRYYFDVANGPERRKAVYHPQWINFGKRYNERLAREAQ